LIAHLSNTFAQHLDFQELVAALSMVTN